jgi:hypothetical protein
VILAAAALSIAYAFPEGQKAIYDFQANMEGYVPIMGRTQNSIELKLVVEIAGTGAKPEGAGVLSEIKEMQAKLSGTTLPFTATDVQTYFPKTNLVVSPAGKVVKTDAPSVQMPIRLPGLDSKRFPEISFLPIEMPVGMPEVGKSWTFKRQFGSTDITYTVTPTLITASEARFAVVLRQELEHFEDGFGYEVEKASSAVQKVATTFAGKGEVVFDRARSLAKSLRAETLAMSEATHLKTSEKTRRELVTKVTVTLRNPGQVVSPLSAYAKREILGWPIPSAVSAWLDRAESGMSLILRLFGFVR